MELAAFAFVPLAIIGFPRAAGPGIPLTKPLSILVLA
jgi:hypothetical protein